MVHRFRFLNIHPGSGECGGLNIVYDCVESASC